MVLLFDRFKLVLDHYVMYNEAKSKYQEEQPMKDQNCGYCMRGELLDAFGIYICDLSVSTLILFKEQSHPDAASLHTRIM